MTHHKLIMGILVLAVILLVSGQVPAGAVEAHIVLKFRDARELAAAFWPGEEDAAEETPESFLKQLATDLVRDAVERMPTTEGLWVPGTATRRYPCSVSSATLNAFLPDGIEGLVKGVPSENAIVVEGTQVSIDKFAELITMLDVPTGMLSIGVRSVSLPAEEVDGWGVDWTDVGQKGEVRLSHLDCQTAVNLVQRSSCAADVKGAELIAANNSPSIVALGEAMPYFAATAINDVFDYPGAKEGAINAVFSGVALSLVPRMNADGTVTVEVRASLGQWAGEVPPPGPPETPMEPYYSSQIVVTTPENQSIIIVVGGGSINGLSLDFGALANRVLYRLSCESVVVITPRFIPHTRPGLAPIRPA